MAGRARPRAREGGAARLHFENCVCGCLRRRGTPLALPAPPGTPCLRPPPPLLLATAWGGARLSWPQFGLPQTCFGGAEELGKVSPTRNSQEPVKREQVWDHEFLLGHRKREAPAPPVSRHPHPAGPSSLKWGQQWNPHPRTRAPPCTSRGRPGSPPGPEPPHLGRAAPYSVLRRPPALHRPRRLAPARAPPLAAASRPGPASRRPQPRAPAPSSGRRRAGEGSEGRPAPEAPHPASRVEGRAHAQQSSGTRAAPRRG